ncbi:hypothetical protein HT136_16385 [Novosphingobium profundi]|uniref:hypothetical protein n=1 Tax=Novosphingobium profundi TaxID=1774954 RepID=UPI001BD9573F|nr:hypothetical protein [Novosphingobium profundi]MBT0669945.1 hypothetical protein [Novosphingobium profundi]
MTEPQPTPDPHAEAEALTRPQRRLLRRLFNGRTEPIVVDGRALLTFQEAKRYLLSLEPDAREAAYQTIRSQGERGTDPAP